MSDHVFDLMKTLDKELDEARSDMMEGNALSSFSEHLYWTKVRIDEYLLSIIKEKKDISETVPTIDDIVDLMNDSNFQVQPNTHLFFIFKYLRQLVQMCDDMNIPIDLKMVLKATDEECPFINHWTYSSMNC